MVACWAELRELSGGGGEGADDDDDVITLSQDGDFVPTPNVFLRSSPCCTSS